MNIIRKTFKDVLRNEAWPADEEVNRAVRLNIQNEIWVEIWWEINKEMWMKIGKKLQESIEQ